MPLFYGEMEKENEVRERKIRKRGKRREKKKIRKRLLRFRQKVDLRTNVIC